MMDIKEGLSNEHWVLYATDESLNFSSETNKKFKKSKNLKKRKGRKSNMG